MCILKKFSLSPLTLCPLFLLIYRSSLYIGDIPFIMYVANVFLSQDDCDTPTCPSPLVRATGPRGTECTQVLRMQELGTGRGRALET